METAGRLVEGVYHTWSTPDDLLGGTRKMVIREDDLWIVTLPKAGTTWTQEVMSLLLNDCNAELADEKPIEKRFLFLDFLENSIPPYKIAVELESPRLIKTHFQSHQMPEELLTKRPKIVYVGRNPKDNAVSLYHFHRSVGDLQKFEDWNKFYDAFVAGLVHGGSWFDMNLYWWGRRNDDNVLFLKYEDMKHDLKSVVAQIAKFLGCEIPNGGMEKILSHCSFASMKNNPMTNYSGVTGIRHDVSPFLRKGVVGDWKNYFTVAQNQAFDKIYYEKLKGSGLVFDFEI